MKFHFWSQIFKTSVTIEANSYTADFLGWQGKGKEKEQLQIYCLFHSMEKEKKKKPQLSDLEGL